MAWFIGKTWISLWGQTIPLKADLFFFYERKCMSTLQKFKLV